MTLRLTIEGGVQGVGFRQYVKSHARKLNIKGWVQNLPNGSVEVLATSDQENLRKLVDICHRGPFLAKVRNLKVEKLESEQLFQSFDIIRQ